MCEQCGINRNIVECKFSTPNDGTDGGFRLVLIETLWNVNLVRNNAKGVLKQY